MTHDSTDPNGHGTTQEPPTEAVFIGGLAIGLMALMAVFTITVLAAAFL